MKHMHDSGLIKVKYPGVKLLSDGTKKYASGLVQAPATTVYVSRGIGTSALRLRWNCRPEIALIVLRADDSATE